MTQFWPDIAGCDIPLYVKKAFDGAIVDELDPFDYLAEGTEQTAQQKVAVDIIVKCLAGRYRRPLNAMDQAKIAMAVVSEWEVRSEKAKEQAFDRSEGAMWRNAEYPFCRNY